MKPHSPLLSSESQREYSNPFKDKRGGKALLFPISKSVEDEVDTFLRKKKKKKWRGVSARVERLDEAL